MDPEIYERVRQIAAEEYSEPIESIGPKTHWIYDLDDSLELQMVVLSCEEEFQIEILDEDAASYSTVGDLATYITKKLGRAPMERPETFAAYPREAATKKPR